MTLRELESGDLFIHAKNKAKKPRRFIALGNAYRRFNGRSRTCYDIKNREKIGKSCKLEVIKIGESSNKEKIQKMYTA